MDTWKIQLVVVAFCALMQTYQAASSSTVGEERSLSPIWQDESVHTSLANQLLSLMKRSKALRFYGLMGKRSGLKKPFQVRRRNKGEAFVGLMGRSISGEEYFQRALPSTFWRNHTIRNPRKIKSVNSSLQRLRRNGSKS